MLWCEYERTLSNVYVKPRLHKRADVNEFSRRFKTQKPLKRHELLEP